MINHMKTAIITDHQLPFIIEEVSTWKEFDALQPEWDQLLSRSSADNYFLTHGWLSVWHKHFGTTLTPFILIARDPETGNLSGIAPLVIEKKYSLSGLSIKEISFMGNGCLQIDHLDFILDAEFEEEVSESFADYIFQKKNKWDNIYLDGLVSTSKTLHSLLKNSGLGKNLIYTETSPYLPLPESWITLKEQLGKNLRYNLGRYLRKLEKNHSGEVTFQVVKTESELNWVMPNLYYLHHQVQRIKRNQKGIFGDMNLAEFHKTISKKALQSDNLRLYSLSVDDVIIAVLYCFKYKDRVLFYQAGYDPEWQSYSPGRLLIAYAIKSSIAEHAKEFDFLRGDEEYKSTWTSKSRKELRVHLSSSIKGQTSMMPLMARKILKTILSNTAD